MSKLRAVCAPLLAALLSVAGCSRNEAPRRAPIILISIDTLRADHVGCYGYSRDTTPSIDSFANEGVRFTTAISQYPGTLKSHMSMFTSLYPEVHRVDEHSALDPRRPTLAEILKAAGYQTAGFAYDCRWLEPRYGFDRGFDRYEVTGANGEERTAAALDWLDHRAQPPPEVLIRALQVDQAPNLLRGDQVLNSSRALGLTLPGNVHGQTLTVVARTTLTTGAPPVLVLYVDGRPVARWPVTDSDFAPHQVQADLRPGAALHLQLESLEARPATDTQKTSASAPPYFLFLHYYDVHSDWKQLPYESPPPYETMFTPKRETPFTGCDDSGVCASRYLLKLNEQNLPVSEEDLAYMRALYDGGVRYTDHEIGLLLEGLKKRHLYDEALIIITADHGEEFRDHGRFLHEQIYDELVHVPLLLKLPQGRRAARTVEDEVETIDLAPTILEVAGVSPPQSWQGRSVLPLLDASSEAARPAYSSSTAVGRAVRTRHWKLIQSTGGKDVELYNLTRDPGEHRNVLAEASRAATAERLARRLEAWAGDNRRRIHELTMAAPAGTARSGTTVNLSDSDKERLRSLGYDVK